MYLGGVIDKTNELESSSSDSSNKEAHRSIIDDWWGETRNYGKQPKETDGNTMAVEQYNEKVDNWQWKFQA